MGLSLIVEKKELLKSIMAEAEVTRKKMTELLTMRLNNELKAERSRQYHDPLEERLGQLEDQIPEVETEISYLTVQNESSETVLQDAKTFYERWPLLTLGGAQNDSRDHNAVHRHRGSGHNDSALEHARFLKECRNKAKFPKGETLTALSLTAISFL